MKLLTQKEFKDQMIAYLVANQSSITDINSGSGIDTQFNAMSIQLNQALVKATGSFKIQFEKIPFAVFGFERKAETFSSGACVFSRAIATPEIIPIPVGTIVGTSGGLLYTTQSTISILGGATSSAQVNIVANKAGSQYDVQAGLINIINSSVPGVNSVLNNTATAGGQAKETNSNYFTRFSIFIKGLSGSNRYGIFTAAVGVSTIQSAYVEDHYPPEAGIYNFTVYVDDGSGLVPSDKLDEVYLEIYGDDSSEYKGYACAGINFRVLSASLVPIDIEYTVQIDPVTVDPALIQSLIEIALISYINSLWVGTFVIHSECITLMQSIKGVVSVKDVTLNGVEEDTEILPSQVARISTITPDII